MHFDDQKIVIFFGRAYIHARSLLIEPIWKWRCSRLYIRCAYSTDKKRTDFADDTSIDGAFHSGVMHHAYARSHRRSAYANIQMHPVHITYTREYPPDFFSFYSSKSTDSAAFCIDTEVICRCYDCELFTSLLRFEWNNGAENTSDERWCNCTAQVPE